MKTILAAVCLLFISFFPISAQISKSNPFDGKIEEIYSGPESKVFIKVSFQKEDNPSLSVPMSSITSLKMTVLDLTVKSAGELQTTTFPTPRLGTMQTPEDDSNTERIFQLDISTNSTINQTNPLRLPKNWEAFSYKITCTVMGEAGEKSTAILSMQKPTAAITGQNFTLNFDKPIWIKSASGTKDNELTVPITSVSASLAAEIALQQGSGTPSTKKLVFLPKGQPTMVKLDVHNFGEAPIQFRVKPTELEGIQLTLSGLDCTNSATDPFCSWNPTANFTQPFRIDREDSDFKSLKITSVAQPKTIVFRTTSAAKPGSMQAKLNGKPIEVKNNTNPYSIELTVETLKTLKEGDNVITVEGQSAEGGLMLSEEPFVFERVTKPALVTYPEFEVDNTNGSFTVKYQLKGDVDPVNAGELRLVYKDAQDKNVGGIFSIPTCTLVEGKTSCRATTSITITNLEPQFKNRQLIPVILTIFAKERGAATPTDLQTLGFNLINQAAVKTILDDIRTQWKNGGGDKDSNNNQALAKIAKDVFLERLPVTDDQVKAAFNKYIKSEATEKRKAWLQGLIAIGNFALKGFGVPIQIPLDLGN